MMSTGVIAELPKLEKTYSTDDANIIIELTKLIQANQQKFYELANLLIPGGAEKLHTLTTNGQVLQVHKILKKKFEHLGKQLNLQRFFFFLNLKCEERMQF